MGDIMFIKPPNCTFYDPNTSLCSNKEMPDEAFPSFFGYFIEKKCVLVSGQVVVCSMSKAHKKPCAPPPAPQPKEPTIQNCAKDINNIVTGMFEKPVVPSAKVDTSGDLYLQFWGWEVVLCKNGRWYLSDTSGG